MGAEIDLRQLRADDLRYLLAVANTGRLTAAADTLGVDYTTVSRRLKALEKVLRVRLLERGPDGWELTEVGRVVTERSRPIQLALEQAALAASGHDEDALSGNFRITAPDGFGALFVVPALERLRRENPNLNIELITATRNLILHQSGFDLAIAVGAPSTGRLFAEKLVEYSLCLYASEEYLERHGTPTSVADLRQRTVVFYIDSMLQVGDLDLAGYLPGVVARFASTNIFAQLEAARVGAGIGILPTFLALRAPELRRLDVGVPPLRLNFTLAARRDGMSRPAVRAVRGVIHDEVRRRRHEFD